MAAAAVAGTDIDDSIKQKHIRVSLNIASPKSRKLASW